MTLTLNKIVQHPFPLSPPNITAQSLPPPIITTEVIYKCNRFAKKTIGYITFYNTHSGLSYTCIFLDLHISTPFFKIFSELNQNPSPRTGPQDLLVTHFDCEEND